MRWLLAVLLFAPSMNAETYILPMYGSPAGSGWYPRVTVLNPHDQPVTVRVVDGFPLISDTCVNCALVTETIPPKSQRTLSPFFFRGGEFVVAGAYVFETSAPLRFDAMYFTFNGVEIRQPIDVVRDFSPAGEHVASAEWGVGVRYNAVIVNPNDFDIEVSVWLEPRAENEVRVAVPARTTRMARLPEHRCGGTPCTFPPDYPPRPNEVHFDSPARFLGGVSAIGPSWAFFRVAGDVD